MLLILCFQNAWELPSDSDMELQTMAGFDKMVPKNCKFLNSRTYSQNFKINITLFACFMFDCFSNAQKCDRKGKIINISSTDIFVNY